MLEMTRGCIVKKNEQLCEQYELKENTFTANVNASKIEKLFRKFITMQSEKLFFILEVPLSLEKEKELRVSNTSPFHNEVFYIDGLNRDKALLLLDKFGELLTHDGPTAFGFGVHDGSSEIMNYRYNEIKLWTKNPKQFIPLFDEFAIPFTDKCITAWETFNKNNPGEARSITIDGMNIYDVLNELKSWGIYSAEIR